MSDNKVTKTSSTAGATTGVPGTIKVEFSFGAHGLDMKDDEVANVIIGSQAASKGVQKGWTILTIDGNEYSDPNKIRPTLQKLSKAGKKYEIVFSKQMASTGAFGGISQSIGMTRGSITPGSLSFSAMGDSTRLGSKTGTLLDS